MEEGVRMVDQRYTRAPGLVLSNTRGDLKCSEFQIITIKGEFHYLTLQAPLKGCFRSCIVVKSKI